MTVAAGIGLAALAAVAYAVAAVLQHGAVRAVRAASGSTGRGLGLAQFRALLGRGRWLAGFLALATGGTLHTMSLALAPLVVVQPVGVLAIGLSVLFSRTRLTRATVVGVGASTAGVAGFVLLAARGVTDATPPSAGARPSSWPRAPSPGSRCSARWRGAGCAARCSRPPPGSPTAPCPC